MKWRWSRTRELLRKAGAARWDLSEPLLEWAPDVTFTVSDACQALWISGASGSGKSTGPLALACRAYLHAGFGGIFFTAKKEDRAMYEGWVRDAGRADDLLLMSTDGALRYNFIDSEIAQSDEAGIVENVTAFLMTAVELLETSESGSREDGGYFKQMASTLARNAIFTLWQAKGQVTMPDLHRLITTAPESSDQVNSESWQKNSFFFEMARLADRVPKSDSTRADWDHVCSFFLRTWPGLGSRTRASVATTLTGATDLLSRGLARDLLSSPTTNISPQMCHEGVIVIVDLPVLVYHDVGRLIQGILKLAWQRAHSRRDVNRNPRPTFMVSDESHLLALRSDQLFLTTARSTRTAVVNVTQSISNYLDLWKDSEARVHSWLGNHQCQVFCQQTDTKTIEYLQSLTGKSPRFLANGNAGQASDWTSSLLGLGSGSAGISETIDYELHASDVNRLAKGGAPHFTVEAIVYQGGKQFPNGRTWMPIAIRQHLQTTPSHRPLDRSEVA